MPGRNQSKKPTAIQMPQGTAEGREIVPTVQWIQAASAVPSDDTYSGLPPRLRCCHWAGCEEPLIIIELRLTQLAAITPGFRRWSDCDVQAPIHRRAVVERTTAGAAVYINDILVASGVVDSSHTWWRQMETCVVAATQLGWLSGNELTLANEFVQLVEAGEVWVAEMPIAHPAPARSRP